MSEFDELMAEVDQTICEELGMPCSYKRGESSVETNVIIDRNLKVLSSDGYTTVTQTHASLPKPVMGCLEGDEVIAGAERFIVVDTLEDDNSSVRLVVRFAGAV